MCSMRIPLLHVLQSGAFTHAITLLLSLSVHLYCGTLCLVLSWVTCEAIGFSRAVDGVEKQVNWACISTLACCCGPSHVKTAEMWSIPPLDPFTRPDMRCQWLSSSEGLEIYHQHLCIRPNKRPLLYSGLDIKPLHMLISDKC